MLRILLSSLIFSTYICTDANVAIQRQNKEYAECGRSITLTCTIQKYVFAMSWLTGNDHIKIAKCIENNCDQNPNYFGKYNFTFDVERGVFNLTINKVTTDDNGRILVCSDGSDVDSRVLKIRGFDPMLLEDIGTGRVMATSGCVSNVTHVSFIWIKVSAISGTEEEFIPTIHGNYTSFCSNESGCFIDEQMQYNVIIQASQSDNGHYYLKMIALYGNELKESSNTTYKYIIDGQGDDDNFNHDIKTHDLAIIIIVAACLFMLFLAIYGRPCSTTLCKRMENWIIHMREKHLMKRSCNGRIHCVDESGHVNRSLLNYLLSQASSAEKTDIDESKKKQEQVFENHKKILLDHH